MRNIAWVLALLLVLAACSKRAPQAVPDAEPGVYYWRTSLRLDSAERAFLAQHDIKKIYLRVFDVGVGQNGRPVPVATLSFADALPAGVRVVPVVFMTEECLRADTTALAQRMVRRVMKMVDAEGLPGVSEVQIDCDWTPRSREAFFSFLKRVSALLKAKGWRLSVTIRLHQLSQPAPPADYGVLMLYNTGDMRSRTTRNPIFAAEDMEPYIEALSAYDLPLCAAYPNFAWKRLFDGERFKGFLYSETLADSTVYAPLKRDSLYRVVQGRTIHGAVAAHYDLHLSPGDEVVVSRPHADEVTAMARRLERLRPGLHAGTIIYHLDHSSLNTYTPQQYETLYHLH